MIRRVTLPARRRLHTALLGCAALGIALVASGSAPAEDKPVDDSFVSGGKKIRVKRFLPRAGEESRSAVVMLHGSDGWDPTTMKAYEFAAEGLTARGHLVILIRQYDRTDTSDEVPQDQRDAVIRWLNGRSAHSKEQGTVGGCFDAWIETVCDAGKYACEQKNVDKDRVGLVGFSLGGYLAVPAAARQDAPTLVGGFPAVPAARPQFRFAALVEMFGGMPAEHWDKVKYLPPTLIIHGTRDRIVPVKEADALCGFMARRGMQVEMKFYEADHALCKPGTAEPNKLALLDARFQMANFFDKYLKAGLSTSAKVEVRPK